MSSGLIFNNTFGSGASATFRNEVVAAETYLQSLFTNTCTVNCNFDLQSINPAYSGENFFSPITVSYSAFVNALSQHATTPTAIAAAASLSHLSDPSHGAGFEVSIGEARILGLAGPGSGTDDSVVLNSYYWTASALQNDPGDAEAVIEHELTEGIMGRIGSLGYDGSTWAPMDLFRFTASGQRDFTGGADGQATYFSVDGSTVYTGLQYHNSVNSSGQFDGFDLADWDQVGADANARDPFGPGGPGTGDPGTLSATDIMVMEALGWDVAAASPPPPPPVVTTSNLTEPVNKTLAASSLFTVSDPNGYAITEYQFWDSTRDPASGHFYINGVQQAPGTVIDIAASQLSQVTFVTGTVSNALQVRAFDGMNWSASDSAAWAPFTVNVVAPALPVVTTSNLTEPANTTLAASSLFTVSDPNGYAITEYQFWDSTRDPASGHFFIGTAQQAPGTVIDIAASQLSQLTFVTGTDSNALQVRAFDGVSWSAGDSAAWAPFSVNIAAPPPPAPPVVTTSNLTEPANTTLAASSLFTVSDPNGYAITEYQFWDSTRDPASGHFFIGTAQQAPGTVIDIAASQLSQLTFVTGTDSNALQVRAFDGVSWSAGNSAAWAPFSVNIAAPPPPVVTTSNLTEPANTTLTASSLFTVSDPNGYAITEYQFWDSTRDPASGHFYINGAQQAPRNGHRHRGLSAQPIDIRHGDDNALQVRAFDGVSWSAGDTAAWAPFAINVAAHSAAAQPQNDVDGRVALLGQYMASTFTNSGSGDTSTSPVGGIADPDSRQLFAPPPASQSQHP